MTPPKNDDAPAIGSQGAAAKFEQKKSTTGSNEITGALRPAVCPIPDCCGLNPSRLLSLPEAAELLRISPRLLQRLTAEGEMPSLKLGNCRRYRLETLCSRLADLEGKA